MSLGAELEAMLNDLRTNRPVINFPGHKPPAGVSKPELYPYVGPHYQGEVQGFVYDYPNDRYLQDGKYTKDFNEKHGLVPKQKSFLDQLLPVLGATGAAGLVQSLVRDPGGFLSGWGDALGFGKSGGSSSGLFGGGGSSSGLGNFDLGSDGLGSLDFSQGGSPLEANPFATAQTEVGANPGLGFSEGGGLFGPEGGFASYGIPAAAALSTYLAGKSILDGFNGEEDNSAPGMFGRGQAAFSTMGLSELSRLFGGGHSQNYFDAENRHKLIDDKFGGKLSLDKTGGGTYDLSADDFEDDRSKYNYSGTLGTPESNKNIDASNPLGYLVTKDQGTTGKQFQQALAEAMQQGADPRKAFEKFGYDYDKAKNELMSSGLDENTKQAYLYGLNNTWGVG